MSVSRRCALRAQSAARRGLSGVKTHGRWQYVAQRSQHAAGRTRAPGLRLEAREREREERVRAREKEEREREREKTRRQSVRSNVHCDRTID